MTTILLADDDEAMRTLLEGVLAGEHYRVVLADNGYEAIKQCLAITPNLLLLDGNIPNEDSATTLRFIHCLEPGLPVILFTRGPHSYPGAADTVDAFLEKPLDLALLLQTIKQLLEESTAERCARRMDPGFLRSREETPGPLPFDPIVNR
jgi:DNA-binding NtrC family response regulator